MIESEEEDVLDESEDVPAFTGSDWSIQTIWNEVLSLADEREFKPREHIWASEIGKNFFERYLKMTGVKPDLEYPKRVLRVFCAGDFYERLMGYILVTAGILKHDNKRYEVPATETTLMVSVKPDFIAGGKPDWEKVRKDLEENPMWNFFPKLKLIAEKLVAQLNEKFPQGLSDLVYEIKSVNSQLFWSKKHYLQEAYPHHAMQLHTEMKATGLPEGRLLYVSKDDLTILEFPLYLLDEEREKLWLADVQQMTHYIKTRTSPPPPQEIVFDKRKKITFQHKKLKYIIQGCYTHNWEIERSMYFPTIMTALGKEEVKDTKKWIESLKPDLKEMNDKLKEEYKVANNLVEK